MGGSSVTLVFLYPTALQNAERNHTGSNTLRFFLLKSPYQIGFFLQATELLSFSRQENR